MAAFGSLLAASGASDVALLRALWTGLGARDVALLVGSLGAGSIDERAPVWPKRGHSPGGSMAAVAAACNVGWWWLIVVVVGRDGGRHTM